VAGDTKNDWANQEGRMPGATCNNIHCVNYIALMCYDERDLSIGM
jgi:hypothetical protein